LKTNDEEKRDFFKRIIHQANVNRDEMVHCMLGMKARGHRAYAHLGRVGSERESQTVARQRHSSGVDFVAPQRNSFEKLNVQKAATPVAAMKDPDTIKQSFKDERPSAVARDESSAEGADIEERRTSALFSAVKQLRGINHGQPEQKYEWKKQAQSRAEAFRAWYPPTTLNSRRTTLEPRDIGFPVLPFFCNITIYPC
jgi:hypothetical protein